MSLNVKVTRPTRGGEYLAELGDVRAYGATAKEAREACERMALDMLVWRPVVVEVTPDRVLVAYINAGRPVYDSITLDGRRACSTSVGDSFAECVETMRRHAEAMRMDVAS